ncbi:hypothetical protein LTR37_005723 [Vermiconidia calcicola]|uniref:Uncharacterized protein n=1 Tax=Vermiconidia calcicola TaxID=1690605 RepID=A0ACC3NLH7_9PEZI|nr:hypothetical protein LTR37_005723 [Vermiconidia calcicola]
MATASSAEDKRTSSSAAQSVYASPTGESASVMSFRDSKTGFLGPTSYNAVFTENPGSLSVITEPYDASDPEPGGRLPPVSTEKIQQGAEVLSMLRDIPIYQRFTQRWFDLCDGIVVLQPVYWIWIDELWSDFGRLLQEGKPDQLRSLSELVWRNTRKPMKVHGQMTAREWARAASGRNLRWELVGTILSMVGLIAVNLSNWDSIFDSIREKFIDRATFAERMRKASEFCLCFCYESEVLNDIYACFMYEDLVLVECIKGDAHYAAWQRTGELCDAIVAMGLHQGNPVDAQTPFFLAELRRKIFISVYGHDKVVATFLGRPPRLSHRYCKMESPLDLSDDQLFLEGPELDACLSTLDANGWNTTGNLHRTTWLRVWFQHCRIREDILEIALGSNNSTGSDEDIALQAQQVRLKLERLHDSYPSFMRIPPEEIINASGGTTPSGYQNFGRSEKAMRQINAIFTLCIHAGIVHTEFLLQRALINRKRGLDGDCSTKELIPTSRRMLGLVLLAQSKRDFFRDFQGDLVYLLTVEGLPAAGVLAIELLKQEQSRIYTPDILPRSETIQDLSVFISSLATVGPGEGNFFICNQGRRALKRVLDQILSPNHHLQNASGPMFAGSLDPAVMGGAGGFGGEQDMGAAIGGAGSGGLYFPTGNDADFLSWLENVEWDKPGAWSVPGGSQEIGTQ